jgi:hypothetical protein
VGISYALTFIEKSTYTFYKPLDSIFGIIFVPSLFQTSEGICPPDRLTAQRMMEDFGLLWTCNP